MEKESNFDLVGNFFQWCFIVILAVLLVLDGSLPVHAAESTTFLLVSNAGEFTSKLQTDYNQEVFTYVGKCSDKNYFYALAFNGQTASDKRKRFLFYKYRIGSAGAPVISSYDLPIDVVAYGVRENGESYSRICQTNYNGADGFLLYCDESGKYINFESTLPIFDSVDSMKNYCLTGDASGLLNGGSIDNPDFEDTAYAFTGFTANNKMTATWTGTTERNYLKDQEVEEYVRVNYYFADKEAQDTIKQADAYPDEFATADKTLTIDVSGLKPDDENWFLRYIRITPCYRQAGLGAWGDFYHGEPSYVYFNQDGSIDRIDAPYIKGELSSDIERPVIVLHEAANGNPTEPDYSFFEFNNAQSDYFFEMKGRWYTTNDFDLYRDKLVWKYKYSTLLKNNLSTWVSVSDNRSSVGRFQFDVLGKSSWDNLLSSYPVDDRNYIGGSYNLFNKITGYSDALETLKMLLKQPYSLFNGYEVYVRYFRYDENGGIQYSKWTHFYNNLADSDGSSGSRLDDLDNMYSENQSDKGLTDDELSDLENGGNSRNDLDAVPKNNYDYSSLENATMNFFDLLKNFGTMLGQFPSMVTDVFGFLPPWLIGLFALAIGAVIVCRFIGR